jgi:hypothetical protein
MKTLDNLEELKSLYEIAKKVVESTATWEVKFDLIFSKDLSAKVFSLTKIEYYDPDTSYEEDVMAFMQAFDEKMKSLGNLVE